MTYARHTDHTTNGAHRGAQTPRIGRTTMTTSTYHGERPLPRTAVVEFATALGYDPATVTTIRVTAHTATVTESDGRSTTIHVHPLDPWLPGGDNAEPDPVGTEPGDVVEERGTKPW